MCDLAYECIMDMSVWLQCGRKGRGGIEVLLMVFHQGRRVEGSKQRRHECGDDCLPGVDQHSLQLIVLLPSEGMIGETIPSEIILICLNDFLMIFNSSKHDHNCPSPENLPSGRGRGDLTSVGWGVVYECLT